MPHSYNDLQIPFRTRMRRLAKSLKLFRRKSRYKATIQSLIPSSSDVKLIDPMIQIKLPYGDFGHIQWSRMWWSTPQKLAPRAS